MSPTPIHFFYLFVLMVCSSSCINKEYLRSREKDNRIDDDKKEELLFQSGFEAGCTVVHTGVNDDIAGRDNSLSQKNDWVSYLEDSVTDDRTEINYTGGDSSKRFGRIINEPGHPENQVLWFWLNDSWLATENETKGRVQLDFNGMKGYKELYQSVKLFLHDDFNMLKQYPDKITWLTIAEFWNNGWWVKTEKHGFRITMTIGKPSATDSSLCFLLKAENAGQKLVWQVQNRNIPVPIGKWITLDYYMREGNDTSGRFYVGLTVEGGPRQTLFDVKGFTHNTYDVSPDGITQYNPMKLYTSKEVIDFMRAHHKTLQIYWDDFKLWKYKEPG